MARGQGAAGKAYVTARRRPDARALLSERVGAGRAEPNAVRRRGAPLHTPQPVAGQAGRAAALGRRARIADAQLGAGEAFRAEARIELPKGRYSRRKLLLASRDAGRVIASPFARRKARALGICGTEGEPRAAARFRALHTRRLAGARRACPGAGVGRGGAEGRGGNLRLASAVANQIGRQRLRRGAAQQQGCSQGHAHGCCPHRKPPGSFRYPMLSASQPFGACVGMSIRVLRRRWLAQSVAVRGICALRGICRRTRERSRRGCRSCARCVVAATAGQQARARASVACSAVAEAPAARFTSERLSPKTPES